MLGRSHRSMLTVPMFSRPLLDPFVDTTFDSLHGLQADGLHSFADKPLEILFDRQTGLLLEQQQERIDLNLHQCEGG